MAEKDAELGWEDINKMGAELTSENGPGSKGWTREGSETSRVNERFMHELRENNGKVSGELGAIPALIVTTTGSKTGAKRAVPLACQIVDGRLLIVASMGGAKRNPPWFYNLVKHSEVLVEKDGKEFLATAVVTEGEDRNYLFEKICEALPTFAEYQSRTDRVIPVVELQRK
jgi:deazaflavin-dependent oxidoreductase (nitroreductase family)